MAQNAAAPPKELVQYVRDAEKAGLQDSQIQENAAKAGWPPEQIVKALALVKDSGSQPGRAPAESAKQGSGGRGSSGVPEVGGVKPAVIDRGVPDDYRIGEGDVLGISVWGEASASVPSVVVRPDGKITIPLVKDVAVAGLTPAQAEKLITDRLAGDIKNADVTVIVTGINSKKIYITGAVRKEGTIPYTYRMTVMQAISEAGGLNDYAKRTKIYVLRNENGRQYRFPFNYNQVLKGEHMEQNIELQPGDNLVIPQ